MEPKALTFSQKLLIIISSLSIAAVTASDLLTYKLFQFHNIIGSASLFIFPLVYLLSDIVTELYGRKAARFLLYITLICECLFDVGLSLIIQLPSPSTFHTQNAYDHVLGALARVYWGGLIALIISALVNISIMSFLKKKLAGKAYSIRSFSSTMIGLILFTTIGYFIWFYGIESTATIIELILVSLLSKLIVVIIMLIPITLLIKILKKRIID
ncbi:queuosine precursor transporter [Thiotrichales bacterium 19X7-9]|nr:queuosine precursor transporter [Thiotrichales bacterium 19X7-9]